VTIGCLVSSVKQCDALRDAMLPETVAMKPDGQMTLTLTGELERFVRDEVRRGAYASSSEYIRDLLRERYLRERDRESALQTLDAALARGIADAEAGRIVPVGEAFRRIRDQLDLPKENPEP
jgi:antitoxin ParD1/3/4